MCVVFSLVDLSCAQNKQPELRRESEMVGDVCVFVVVGWMGRERGTQHSHGSGRMAIERRNYCERTAVHYWRG